EKLKSSEEEEEEEEEEEQEGGREGGGGGKGVVGARRPVGPGSPSPAAVVRRSLSRPPSPPSHSRWWCGGPGLGRLARERVPRMLSPRGQTWMEDGSVVDGRTDGRMEEGLAGRHAGPGGGAGVWGPLQGLAGNGRRPRRRGTALVRGWRSEEKKLTRIPSVTASEQGRAQRRIPAPRWGAGHVAYGRPTPRRRSWGAQVLLIEAQPVDGVRP
ncbi:unnamed protein product, partial [Rangifer tarandus platyrhynchus]